MPKDDELLRSITTFPKLVAYLRDELEWPIEETSFEDLTFEYEPEELGLDPKTAIKVRSIKQLRPLTAGQPWGVFFVEFERKRLPVVVMRRILSALALKKRASAGKSGQAAWRASDLLFVSSFGEEGGRGITFAHFAPDEQGHDLPALKVLGWDGDDTKLHTQAVAESLASSLTWPSDEGDINAWRTQWSSAFVLANREVVTTSRELSIQLAILAVGIRERAKALLASESDRGPLRKLHKAFKEALLHDLDEDGFADMYAQTVAYGLLAARLENPDSPTPLTASALADMIPATSPFLKGLLSTFLKVGGRRGYLDFDELGIGDVVDLLRNAKMKAILLDFGDLKPEEDPVLHFYELFLNEYDHAQKMKRGVFYTPKPVVHYIVHSIDEMLRTEFGLDGGLADTATWEEMAARHPGLTIPKGLKPDDPFVQVLDPATGTATFLVEVIDVIYHTMTAGWRKQGKGNTDVETLWNEYVPLHLLPRLYGFEVQMAPYTIAHIKLGLKLRETGYAFASSERARVYLTDTLSPSTPPPEELFLEPAIAKEVSLANQVKNKAGMTVIIGNPPYSGSSANRGTWITNLLKSSLGPGSEEQGYYKVQGRSLSDLGEKNTRFLLDDYVKFVRYAQYTIYRSGVGVLGFITNNGYLDNLTFAGLRSSMLQTFDSVTILDLRGNTKRLDKAADGTVDENVFDIEPGVAIGLWRRHVGYTQHRPTTYAQLEGTRSSKFAKLAQLAVQNMTFSGIEPRPPKYLLLGRMGQAEEPASVGEPMVSLMPLHANCIITKRDSLVVDFDAQSLAARISDFCNQGLSDSAVTAQYGVSSNYEWDMQAVRRRSRYDKKRIVRYLYRPFDIRYLYYDDNLIARPTHKIVDNVGMGNLFLILGRAGAAVGPHWSLAFATTLPVDWNVFRRGGGTTFPERVAAGETIVGSGAPWVPNCPEGCSRLADWARDGTGNSGVGSIGADAWHEVFLYVYAVLYSEAYRSLYAPSLLHDFPAIPTPRDQSLFRQLAELGDTLVQYHLLESAEQRSMDCQRFANGVGAVDHVKYDEETNVVRVNSSICFDRVTPEVWSYDIGGYRVCEKWLKDRGPKGGEPGRVLTPDDILHYRKILTAIAKTIELQAEIDRVIAAAGGFPAAFEPRTIQ